MSKKTIKNIFFLFVLCLLAQQQLVAQDSLLTKPKVRIQQEIGVNSTLLFKQLLSFGNSSIPLSPYVFTYKAIRKGNGIRLGFGGSSQSQKETQGNFADNKTTVNETISGRLGFEHQRKLGEKCLGWIGLDGVYSQTINKNISDSGFDRVTLSTELSNVGGAIALGAEYKITKYLSIGTEANLMATYQTNATRRIFTTVAQTNTDKVAQGWNFETIAPTSIFVILKL